jgi:uncharacterized protein YigE (DUF2233 family)
MLQNTFLTVLVLVAGFSTPSLCSQTERLETPTPVEGVSVRSVDVNGQRFVVVAVDLTKVELDLYGQAPGWEATRTIPALQSLLGQQGRKVVVAMNAGIFESPDVPTGLHIERTTQLSPLNLSQKAKAACDADNFYLAPNGVFYVDTRGAHISVTSKYLATASTVRLATQSGPMLVYDSMPHACFTRFRKRLLRNAIGVKDERLVYFAATVDSSTFSNMATLFRDSLGCANALYMDGSISSLLAPGFWISGSRDQEYAGILTVTVPRVRR